MLLTQFPYLSLLSFFPSPVVQRFYRLMLEKKKPGELPILREVELDSLTVWAIQESKTLSPDSVYSSLILSIIGGSNR